MFPDVEFHRGYGILKIRPFLAEQPLAGVGFRRNQDDKLAAALCILFYLAYYAFLAGFFMGMMMVFLYTQVPDDRPARTGMQSLLHFKPGILGCGCDTLFPQALDFGLL